MTPGLIGRAASSTVISFRPSQPIDERELAELPGAASVQETDRKPVISGTGQTVGAGLSLPATHRITANQLAG